MMKTPTTSPEGAGDAALWRKHAEAAWEREDGFFMMTIEFARLKIAAEKMLTAISSSNPKDHIDAIEALQAALLPSEPSTPGSTEKAAAPEYELVAVRNWLVMHLQQHVEHREPKGTYGASRSVTGTDGWAVVAIPDWDVRQHIDRINEALKPSEPVSPQPQAKAALELLADISHLWIDGYIAKAPNSAADASISNSVFDRVDALLEASGIAVDYCGWRYRAAVFESPLPQPEFIEVSSPAHMSAAALDAGATSELILNPKFPKIRLS